ncbi:MAG: serine hydrolase [Clostridia bacterium]|nr:serine hydrolase [Clostridia bacterium]
MFEKVSPESLGISSENIQKFVELLEENRFSTHDILIARGDKLCFEKYYAPFKQGDLHRIYSSTKSFVGLAIGCLEQDGLINLDDRIDKYFPEETKNQPDENLKSQSIRDMLRMSTGKPCRHWWFGPKCTDRVRFYFENPRKETRPAGGIFEYDSMGSFVLGALVERITGMPFIDYLRTKFLDEIGFSKEAYCLKCPGGHSWGDSALLCTPRDFLLTARFVMNGGEWNGKQLLNREYIKAATSKQIDVNVIGDYDYYSRGYGYQFRLTYGDGFLFNGMGCQQAVCIPEKDLILIYNGDNQGKDYAYKLVVDGFFKIIANHVSDAPLPENPAAQEALHNYVKDLKLAVAIGEKESDWMDKINGKTYTMCENDMGITKIGLEFKDGKGYFNYTNAQGDKTLEFGMCENTFGLFPQEGYADEVGGVYTPGHYLKCAASAAWVMPHQLFIKVQIIDKYFGNLNIMLGFVGNQVSMFMKSAAEDFLEEYQGYAGGVLIKE